MGNPTKPVRILPKWFKPALVGLGAGLLLITGIVLGVSIDIVFEFIKRRELVEAAMWFVVAVALVGIMVLLVLKRWVVPSASDAGKKLVARPFEASGRAMEAVLKTLSASLGIDSTEDRPETAALRALRAGLSELSAEWSGIKRNASDLVSAYLIGRGYWFTLAALAGILGAAIAAGQLVVMVEQTEKLEKQNTLLTSQNLLVGLQTQIAAITSKADLDMAQAQRRYDEIGRILDESKSPAAQEYALLSLPDAMVMPVVMVDPDWKPGPDDPAPKTVTQYPNLHRLAERLVLFAKQPRITEIERLIPFPLTPRITVPGEHEVPSATVSTAICRALHRVGYGGSEAPKYGECLWDLVYTEYYGTLNDEVVYAMPLHQLLRPDPWPASAEPSEFEPFISNDLRHLKHGQLLGAELSGANFLMAQLESADLRGANLKAADLSGATLQSTDLLKANLQGANLGGADLQNADLRWANLHGVNLGGADLRKAGLSFANLHGAVLAGANLRDCSLSSADLQGADLSGADLQGLVVIEAKWMGMKLSQAHLQMATLVGAFLQGAVLTEADLKGAGLNKANLQGSNLRRACMQGAYLIGSNLQGANLTQANLQGANLTGANLQGANLTQANLQGANLTGANLQGANLTGANLRGANFSWAFFEAGTLQLLAVNLGDHGYWTTHAALDVPVPKELQGIRIELHGAVLEDCTTGSGWVMESISDESYNAQWFVRRAFADGSLNRAVWETREEAEAAVKAALGDNFVKLIIERPTTFKDAKLTGVFISQATIDSWPANGTDIPPAELFKDAVKDPVLIEERVVNQFRLPDAAEFITSRQAAPAPSSPPAADPSSLPEPGVRPP